MTSKKAEKWLEERGITLQENFVTALKKLAKDFQKEHGIKNIEEVYSLIGLKKQYLVYWSKNPHSVQTKKLQVKNNLYCCRSI
ncbi:putative uncharacterized protein [Fusobacterium sp. CAG:439]|nr:putative uncharacterized protein [Fusobacterium sp. CAG:439]